MNTMTFDAKRVKAYAEHEINYIVDCLYAEAMDQLEDRLFYQRRGNKIMGQCPCTEHGGDRSGQQSFSYNLEIKLWACWSHHCEKNYGGDIIGLVRSIKNLSFKDSLSWLSSKLEKCGGFTPSVIQEKPRSPIARIVIDELRLKFLVPKYDYLIKRGFDPVILRQYEVGVWERPGTFMHNRIIFPIRDELGSLVGFTGRTLYSTEEADRLEEKKWKHGRFYDRHVENWPGGQYLFNLFRAKRHLGPEKKIILVEGPLDGMKLEEAGIHNWTACLGCSMGKAHKDLLVEHGVNRIDLALDPDEAGDKACLRIMKEFQDHFHFNRVRLSQDPGACSLEELKRAWV